MTQPKRKINAAQTAAIEEYRESLVTQDFNRLLFAIVGLSDAGLDEEQATELIAMGFTRE